MYTRVLASCGARPALKRTFSNLPQGWLTSHAPCGSVFFYNEKTNTSSWEAPKEEMSIPPHEVAPSRESSVNVHLEISAANPLPDHSIHSLQQLVSKHSKRVRALETRIASTEDPAEANRLRRRAKEEQDKTAKFLALIEKAGSQTNSSKADEIIEAETSEVVVTDTDIISHLSKLLTSLKSEASAASSKAADLQSQSERLHADARKLQNEASVAREACHVANGLVKRLEVELNSLKA